MVDKIKIYYKDGKVQTLNSFESKCSICKADVELKLENYNSHINFKFNKCNCLKKAVLPDLKGLKEYLEFKRTLIKIFNNR